MEDFEYTRDARDCWGNVLTAKVNKVGGGTVGKAYSGELWDVKIYNAENILVFDTESDLRIGYAAVHEDAVYEAMEFYENSISE